MCPDSIKPATHTLGTHSHTLGTHSCAHVNLAGDGWSAETQAQWECIHGGRVAIDAGLPRSCEAASSYDPTVHVAPITMIVCRV